MGFVYQEEHEAFLKELAATEMSRSAMATAFSKHFGVHVSRNAMIGKIIRLGLSTATGRPRGRRKIRRVIVKAERAAPKPRAGMVAEESTPSLPFSQYISTRTGQIMPGQSLPLEPIVEAPEDTAVDRATLIKIRDLENNHCRYPIGDPKDADFGCCGKQREPGLPYCAAHAQRCSTGPVKPKKGPAPRKVIAFVPQLDSAI